MAQIKLYLANTIFSTKINEKWHNLNEKWHIKLYLAKAIFSTEINEKWHNLNEIWHNSNYIWHKQYFQSKSMKNGTVQSRVKINEGEQYIVNLSKSRRRIGMVWLYYLISDRTCCVFSKICRNEQCPARSSLFVLSHVCLLKS